MKHLVLAAAVMAALSSAAEAQPAVELELGGGYHYAVDLGGDWFTVPSAPSIDFRATRWGSGRWGVATRALLGIGGGDKVAPLPRPDAHIDVDYLLP